MTKARPTELTDFAESLFNGARTDDLSKTIRLETFDSLGNEI